MAPTASASVGCPDSVRPSSITQAFEATRIDALDSTSIGSHSSMPASGASSTEIRERVAAARRVQLERGVASNAEIADRALDELTRASPEARALLGRAVDSLRLSARAARRVLRVARTIADLAQEPGVGSAAIAEALSYRDECG